MILKHRQVPKELVIFRYLQPRMNFSATETTQYSRLEKGFEGEQMLDERLKNISNDFLILNDLLYEINNTVFQIDTLVISQESINLFEVKNYEGDYYLEKENWLTTAGMDIKNPIHQLKRCESLFRRLLLNLGYKTSLEPYVIFINPDFHLYQAPLNLPIVFPTQLNRFMNKLNKKSTNLNSRYTKLAELLVSKQIAESPYERLPNYTYEQLVKGIVCVKCQTFVDHNIICSQCGFKEDHKSAILRSIEEFRTLFPNSKLTTRSIHEWCNGIVCKKTIWKVLSNNFEHVGYGKQSHFIDCK